MNTISNFMKNKKLRNWSIAVLAVVVISLLVTLFIFSQGQFGVFTLGDILIGAIPTGNPAIRIPLHVDVHQNIAYAAICKDDAMLQLSFKVGFRRSNSPANFASDKCGIIRVDKKRGILFR